MATPVGMKKILPLMLALQIGTSVAAQQPHNRQANVDPRATESHGTVEAIKRVAAARQLIDKGLKEKDAHPLIEAARIFRQLETFNGTIPKKVSTPNLPTLYSVTMSESLNRSVDQILKRARTYATGNAEQVALIDQVAAMPKVAAGGRLYTDTVPRKSVVSYELLFRSQRRAAIYIETHAENASLLLAVRDAGDNLICEDRRRESFAYCEWTPRESGPFRVRVSNAEDREQEFMLMPN